MLGQICRFKTADNRQPLAKVSLWHAHHHEVVNNEAVNTVKHDINEGRK
jgi:hypothetical protein